MIGKPFAPVFDIDPDEAMCRQMFDTMLARIPDVETRIVWLRRKVCEWHTPEDRLRLLNEMGGQG